MSLVLTDKKIKVILLHEKMSSSENEIVMQFPRSICLKQYTIVTGQVILYWIICLHAICMNSPYLIIFSSESWSTQFCKNAFFTEILLYVTHITLEYEYFLLWKMYPNFISIIIKVQSIICLNRLCYIHVSNGLN